MDYFLREGLSKKNELIKFSQISWLKPLQPPQRFPVVSSYIEKISKNIKEVPPPSQLHCTFSRQRKLGGMSKFKNRERTVRSSPCKFAKNVATGNVHSLENDRLHTFKTSHEGFFRKG